MKIRFLTLFVLIVFAGASALAQQVPDLQALAEVRRIRAELADDIAAGRVQPAAALIKLKERRFFFAAAGDADVDQAQAAADIGQRLLNAAPGKASIFFRAAEISLGVGLNRTADPVVKARLLVNRAQLRSQHLNNKVEAAADIEQAAKLQPDDPYVQSWRELLRRRDAQALQTQKNN